MTELKDQTIRKSNGENSLNNICSTCSINDHALQIEKAVKGALQASIVVKKVIEKPWIFAQTFNLADEKRKMKQV